MIKSSWVLEEARQRKYYVLSELGIDILEKLTKEWVIMVNVMEQLLGGKKTDGFN